MSGDDGRVPTAFARGSGGTLTTMPADQSALRRFRTAAEGRPRGGFSIAIPFDPATAWGERDQYHVHGTVGGHPFRGPLADADGSWSLQLGPAWCRAPGFRP